MRRLGVLAVVVAVSGCGASLAPGATATTDATTTATTEAPTTTLAVEPTTSAPPSTVPGRGGDPTTTTLPTSLPPPPSPPGGAARVTAAPGPPFEDASCHGDITGTFTYVDGSTASVRTSATDFCVADGAAGMTMPYLPASASASASPYVGVSGDSWLGGFAVVALPATFPPAFTVWRADGVEVPAVLGADGRSLLVRVHDLTIPTGHGELTFKTPDGTIFAVTGPP